jgi:hypothetical protein
MLTGATALAAVAVTGGVVALSTTKRAAKGAQPPRATTAKVEKGTLAAVLPLNGTLTYAARADGAPYGVINQSAGTATWLPALGQVVEQGQVLYRVDGNPVVLLYGSTPAYRALSVGMSGEDVGQLNADLVALGDATADEIPAGTNSFTPATSTALTKLQATLGITQADTLSLGQAVFEPGALRVTAEPATLGGIVQPGQLVLQGTSTTRVVTIDLDAAQQSEVRAGDPVVITLPSDSSTPGVVTSVGTVATTPSSASGGGGKGVSVPTIAVQVQPTDPAATGSLDQAPVRVEITTAQVENALNVPVTALVGKSGGGFAVEVVRADGRHDLVAVQLGLVDTAGGRVQVEGALHEGDQVVVPSL